MLATLLVLAIINGGTLNFTHPERLAVMEANITGAFNENVGVVSQNVDTVASQVTDVRDQLAAARSQVNNTLAQIEAATAVNGLETAAATLAVTGEQFDTFVKRLTRR